MAVGSVVVALSLGAAPDSYAAVAVAVAAGGPVRGLDISAFQHVGAPIDWRLLAREGIRFVAIKVSESTYYTNPYYPSDARAAAAAGLAVMPYAFANPSRAGGAATARFAVSAEGFARGLAPLPLVVDLENDPYKAAHCYGLHIPTMIAWIAGFIAEARALTRKSPIIYTTYDWWQQCTHSSGRFLRDPLWLAAFDVSRPSVPSPWGQWSFWQYNGDGFLAGIGETDLDYYQPTSGLPTLRAPARTRTRKGRASAKPKRSHERRLNRRRAEKAKARHRPRPVRRLRRGPQLVSNHQIPPYPHQSRW
jgi:GH25 family lysozyme M1 (1,4-beta-N-acetylmuramidase)